MSNRYDEGLESDCEFDIFMLTSRIKELQIFEVIMNISSSNRPIPVIPFMAVNNTTTGGMLVIPT